MKYLKTCESHYSEKMVDMKKEIIDKFIELIDEWSMPYFYIGLEVGDDIYKAPLSMINLSHPAIKSCKEWVCSQQVFVK